MCTSRAVKYHRISRQAQPLAPNSSPLPTMQSAQCNGHTAVRGSAANLVLYMQYGQRHMKETETCFDFSISHINLLKYSSLLLPLPRRVDTR